MKYLIFFFRFDNKHKHGQQLLRYSDIFDDTDRRYSISPMVQGMYVAQITDDRDPRF
jgi:hypothetical protein